MLFRSENDAATAIDRQVGDLRWLASHAAPWIGRRLRGRTAGDGREPKRPELLPVLAPAASPVVGDATSAVHRRKTRPLLG